MDKVVVAIGNPEQKNYQDSLAQEEENRPVVGSASRESLYAVELMETEEQFNALRNLLLGNYQTEIAELTTEMEQVQTMLDQFGDRINDKEGLVEMITPIIANSIRTSIRDSRSEMITAISPIMADTIRTNIRDSKDEMVEALYPILGHLIQRAVREAMSDLVNRIDSQIHRAFSFQDLSRQIQARIRGVSPAELALREALPFDVTDLFLIHKETGILLCYLGDDDVSEITLSGDLGGHLEFGDELSEQPYDHDLISGMLTAIQDFVKDAFGRDEEGHLDRVTYGDKQIHIETAKHAYLAIVVEGTEPVAFRTRLLDHLMLVENDYIDLLRDFDGNVAALEPVKEQLRPLVQDPLTLSERFDSQEHMSIQTAHVKTDTQTSAMGSVPTFNAPFLGLGTLSIPLKILLFVNLVIFLIWWLIVS